MPSGQLTNVAGVNGLGFSSGPVIQDVYNSSTTATIPFGTLVALVTPITTTTTTVFAVGVATTTASRAPLNIGIAVAGAAEPGPGSVIGTTGTGQVVIHGHCRALVGVTVNPSVVGHTLIVGAVAGTLDDAGGTTQTAGVNYGVVLEGLATTTTGTLVNIWFEKV